MSSPVQLYVYDLSNGMAKQLSRQLTGRQIDGVWHTSVVVFGKEVFYGQGISITQPGRSHHGQPLQIVDMGETAIDEDTFEEYLTEMRDHYTADKYHLLDFNCNSFTNDCVGFLTGGSIPSFIKDLPADFLSTPFGAALRPTIDSMFRGPGPATGAPTPPPTTAAAAPSLDPQLTASILQAVAAQAQSQGLPTPPPTQSPTPTPLTGLTAPIHPSTNPASFNSFIHTHKAVVAFFTSATCPPCRMIEPVFESLASEKGIKSGRQGGIGAAFTKIDLGVGLGNNVAGQWGVRVTPTFIFFLDGKKIHEMKGADANELRTQIDLLIFQAYPPHPHKSLSIPAIQAISLNPILFAQVPALDTVLNKLISFVDLAPQTSWSASLSKTPVQVKQTLTDAVVPYLKSRFAGAKTASPPPNLPSATPALLSAWTQVTVTLIQVLPIESLFPLVDMWRLALLDPAVGSWSASVLDPNTDPISILLIKANTAVQTSAANSRNYILTVLRLLSNAFCSPPLARKLLSRAQSKGNLTSLLVPTLLHADAAVRTAAASLAFNVAAWTQKGRGGGVGQGEEEDWEVEMVSAVVEALDREKGSEEVVHRLTASLALLLLFSPFWESQLSSLLDVLQARTILKSKLVRGGCGELGVTKKEVKRLIDEVAGKLCP